MPTGGGQVDSKAESATDAVLAAVSFTPTPEELAAFYQYCSRDQAQRLSLSATERKRRNLWSWTFWIALAAMLVLALSLPSIRAAYFIFGLVAGVGLGLVVVPAAYARVVHWRSRGGRPHPVTLGYVQDLAIASAVGGLRCELRESGVRVSDSSVEVLYRWPSIDRVVGSHGILHIHGGHGALFFVPMRAFSTPTESDAFIDVVNTRRVVGSQQTA